MGLKSSHNYVRRWRGFRERSRSMEELPALTTSKCNQLAPFVIVRIQIYVSSYGLPQEKEFQMRYSLKSLKRIFPLGKYFIG